MGNEGLEKHPVNQLWTGFPATHAQEKQAKMETAER